MITPLDDATLAALVVPEPQAVSHASPDLTTMVTEMVTLKAEIDSLEDSKKTAQARYDELRKRLIPAKMDELKLKGVKLDDGGSVNLRSDTYANVLKENEPAFFDWLRENGHGALIKETVNAQTLKGWARELIEGGTALPETVRVHTELVAVYTRPRSQ